MLVFYWNRGLLHLTVIILCFLLFTNSNICKASRIESFAIQDDEALVSESIDTNPDAFVEILERKLRSGNLEGYTFIAKRLYQKNPTDSKVAGLLAIGYTQVDDYERAEVHLQQAKSLSNQPSLTNLMAEAMILRFNKKNGEAKRVIEKAILLDSTHPYPLNILGRVYFDLGNYQTAIKSFEKALALEPNFLPAHINIGNSYLLLNNFQKAENSFKQAITINPRNTVANRNLVVLYETNGQYTLAASYQKKQHELEPDNSKLLTKLAILQLMAGLYDQAYVTGQKMATLHLDASRPVLAKASLYLGKADEALKWCKSGKDNDTNLLYTLALTHITKEEYELALATTKKILSLEPDHVVAGWTQAALELSLDPNTDITKDKIPLNKKSQKPLFYLEGNQAAFHGKYKKALTRWHAADNFVSGYSIVGLQEQNLLQGFKKDELTSLNIGLILFLNKLYASAEKNFHTSIQHNSQSLFGNYWLAQVKLNNGQLENALESYKAVLEVAPDFFSALYASGEIHYLLGKPNKAVQYYEKAYTIQKEPGLILKLGIYNESQQKNEKAANFYRELIALQPNNFFGFNQLAWLFAKQGTQLDEAMKLARKADTLQPGNASILDTIGWIYYHKKNFNKALKNIQLSLGAVPDNPPALYHLAKVQLAMGKKDAAKKNLQLAVASKTPFEEIEDAKTILNKLHN